MSRIRAGHGESALEGRFFAAIRCPNGIIHHAIAASSALHHEVVVPGVLLRQSDRKADAVLHAVNALAPVNNAFHPAMRRQRARIARIRGRNRLICRSLRGTRNFHPIDLQAGEIGAGRSCLRLDRHSCTTGSRCQNQESVLFHAWPSFSKRSPTVNAKRSALSIGVAPTATNAGSETELRPRDSTRCRFWPRQSRYSAVGTTEKR